MEYPIADMSANTPTKDKGIVTTGIVTERSEPKNKNIIKITMPDASKIVFNTSFKDA